MLAARLTAPNRLEIAQIDDPTPGPGGALIRVHAAAITRDELTWPLDRLPAIPSYEISGTVAVLGPGADGLAVDDEVFALTPFGRDGGRRRVRGRAVSACGSVLPLSPYPHCTMISRRPTDSSFMTNSCL